MSLLRRLFSPKPDPREALRPLWQAIVDEARRPDWYAARGVEDTVSGRFDMVSAVFSLVLLHMEKDGDLARDGVLLTELFVQDMDGQLREFGVGDPVVGKHIGKIVGATGGRVGAYFGALMKGDEEMRSVVRRNMTLRDDADVGAIATELQNLANRLSRTDDDELLAGRFAQ